MWQPRLRKLLFNLDFDNFKNTELHNCKLIQWYEVTIQ